jgi:hypothetical protein
VAQHQTLKPILSTANAHNHHSHPQQSNAAAQANMSKQSGLTLDTATQHLFLPEFSSEIIAVEPSCEYLDISLSATRPVPLEYAHSPNHYAPTQLSRTGSWTDRPAHRNSGDVSMVDHAMFSSTKSGAQANKSWPTSASSAQAEDRAASSNGADRGMMSMLDYNINHHSHQGLSRHSPILLSRSGSLTDRPPSQTHYPPSQAHFAPSHSNFPPTPVFRVELPEKSKPASPCRDSDSECSSLPERPLSGSASLPHGANVVELEYKSMHTRTEDASQAHPKIVPDSSSGTERPYSASFSVSKTENSSSHSAFSHAKITRDTRSTGSLSSSSSISMSKMDYNNNHGNSIAHSQSSKPAPGSFSSSFSFSKSESSSSNAYAPIAPEKNSGIGGGGGAFSASFSTPKRHALPSDRSSAAHSPRIAVSPGDKGTVGTFWSPNLSSPRPPPQNRSPGTGAAAESPAGASGAKSAGTPSASLSRTNSSASTVPSGSPTQPQRCVFTCVYLCLRMFMCVCVYI